MRGVRAHLVGAMSMSYIRRAYGVPAKRGGRVVFTGVEAMPLQGTITGADGGHLRIRMDRHRCCRSYHPTWELRYLDGDAK